MDEFAPTLAMDDDGGDTDDMDICDDTVWGRLTSLSKAHPNVDLTDSEGMRIRLCCLALTFASSMVWQRLDVWCYIQHSVNQWQAL